MIEYFVFAPSKFLKKWWEKVSSVFWKKNTLTHHIDISSNECGAKQRMLNNIYQKDLVK